MNHLHTASPPGLSRGRFAALALGLALVAGATAWGSRLVIRLGEARTASTAAWDEIGLIYAERHRLAMPALQAAGHATGVDPQLVEAARGALARAAALPGGPGLLDDPRALDAFKRNQGELTGLLFRLVLAAQRQPALRDDAAVQGLHRQLLQSEPRLAEARERYSRFADHYNALTRSMPDAIAARLAGYASVPTHL
ncbi:LemA family protein [Rhizobacter sp. SG703]|uniref:LemA family protein n=1 Tax=Rhizobacter sp. SG703 TaxID=2587140 RepID=UPI001445F75A|nr:LemA family protein [Rhizobacter sp. SG703]NKI92150.1 LemA protein [Rhizobacter sp. SG703]